MLALLRHMHTYVIIIKSIQLIPCKGVGDGATSEARALPPLYK